MKIFKSPIIAGLLVAVLSVIAFFGVVSAQNTSMTETQISRIRSNCVIAKNTLTQLHASDALLRVNRGQIYESMTTKLMSRFNSRASSNQLDASNLISLTQSYGSALAAFRTDYQAYEEQLSNALGIDCTKEPVAFYDSVGSARAKRIQVHAGVVILHRYIDDYKSAFDVFAANFAKTQGGNQ